MPTAPATGLGVVLPARDEQELVAAALDSLDRAAEHIRAALHIVVVLDACTDGTAHRVSAAAERMGSRVDVVPIDGGRVGTARRVGVSRLLDILGDGDHWIATTDADSRVPTDWFAGQLRHRSEGADLVVGTVHVDDWPASPVIRRRWETEYLAQRHWRADGHRHVHGANLAFSAAGYRRSGGFADVSNDEDVELVRAFITTGQQVAWADDCSVATSGRRIGRAPGGFAGHLARLASAGTLNGELEPSW